VGRSTSVRSGSVKLDGNDGLTRGHCGTSGTLPAHAGAIAPSDREEGQGISPRSRGPHNNKPLELEAAQLRAGREPAPIPISLSDVLPEAKPGARRAPVRGTPWKGAFSRRV
jgi:hypothetical protein